MHNNSSPHLNAEFRCAAPPLLLATFVFAVFFFFPVLAFRRHPEIILYGRTESRKTSAAYRRRLRPGL